MTIRNPGAVSKKVESAGELVEAVTEAHGGIDLWRSADGVSVKVTARGLAFSLKGQGRAITDVEGTVSTEGQHISQDPSY